MAATNTAVPGRAMKFRSTIAASGSSRGATGGTRKTALCRAGMGQDSAGKSRCFRIAGNPVTKMSTEAMRNGDQPLRTAIAPCRVTGASLLSLLSLSRIRRGRHTLRKATITSRENRAATTSTRPLPCQLDQ